MNANMRDAARRAVATFVAGATAAPITSAIFDIAFLHAAGIAGVIALWNFAGRWAQFTLESK